MVEDSIFCDVTLFPAVNGNRSFEELDGVYLQSKAVHGKSNGSFFFDCVMLRMKTLPHFETLRKLNLKTQRDNTSRRETQT